MVKDAEKILSYRYGHYIMTVEYCGDDFARVKIDDLSNLRFPLMWATSMTYKQANSAIQMFKQIGYFEMA